MNEKIEQVRLHVVENWLSNNSTITIPLKKLCIFTANENKEHVGLILCAHMQCGICGNLAISKESPAGTSHEWIDGWGGCCTLWGHIFGKRIVLSPPLKLNEEFDSRRISATK